MRYLHVTSSIRLLASSWNEQLDVNHFAALAIAVFIQLKSKMSIRIYGDHDGVYVREHKQLVDILRIPSDAHYKPPLVFEVGLQAKRAMVKPSNKIYVEGERVMKALKTIDLQTSVQFGMKRLAVEKFTFKLLQDKLNVDTVNTRFNHEAREFMILSYACHSSWWTPHDCLKYPSPMEEDKECPLTPVMWDAFLKQRLSPAEPYWVDSLCITQTLGHEKSFAIGAMDYVYRAARKVIVVIEDAAISKSEMDAILRYAETNEPMHVRDEADLKLIAQAYGRILKARWFQRAWCLHEFNTSNKHVFLVPVCQSHEKQLTKDSETTLVLRIDAPFLDTISRVYVLQDIESQRSGSASLINTPYMNGKEIQNLHRFMKRLSALNMAEVFGTEEVHTDGSYMHMFAEIFSLGAFLTADKMSVLLNVMDSGLFYQAGKELTEELSCLLITTIALAAGDVTALTTNGKPLSRLEAEQETKYGWIRMPGSGDQARPLGAPTIPRSSMDMVLTEKGLEIDLVFIPNHRKLTAAEHKYQSLARLLIDHRAMTHTPTSEAALWLDFETDESTYMQARLYYIQALACVLQCGKEWTADCRSRLGADFPGVDFGLKDDFRQNLEDAVEWASAIDLENDIDPDMQEIWEDEDEDESEENKSRETAHRKEVDEYDEETNISATYTTRETQDWHRVLLTLVDEIIVTGLAISYGSERGEENVPYSVQIYEEPHCSPFLVFAPSWTSERRYDLCVPKCLLPETYSWTSRLWILEQLGARLQEGQTALAGAEEDVESWISGVPESTSESPPMKSYALQAKTRLVGITPAPRGRMERALIAG